MKKFIIPAAIVAMMGVGGYFGRQALNTRSGMSELVLANAEALSDDAETKGYLVVVDRPDIPGCVCGGTGKKLCCDDPGYPGEIE